MIDKHQGCNDTRIYTEIFLKRFDARFISVRTFVLRTTMEISPGLYRVLILNCV